jgi:hypothetical protein
VATFDTTGAVFGGLAVDREVFRRRLPDYRWYVYAAGLVDPRDANTATLELVYHLDDNTLVSLGSITQAGAGMVKRELGPFDVFNTPGVPAGETIPIVRLRATKTAGVPGEVVAWVIWNRFLAYTRGGP